jgi:O-acetyl-ADP-ribose deacetylase (regulator of RNase III)
MQIEVIQGDITKLVVDCIVNAANPALVPGGGVCGAIHRAAGPELAKDCEQFEMGCHTGDVEITPGFNLPAQYVIHAVGPIYHDGTRGESLLLRSTYQRALELAARFKFKTIAFPAISTGIYGYPLDEACAIAVDAIRKHGHIEDIARYWHVLTSGSLHAFVELETVFLIAFDEKTYSALCRATG